MVYNLVLFRLVQVSLLVTSIVSFAIQLIYLSTTTFVLERDLMFIINLILLSIKLLLITLEFFYKNHVLRSAPTVLSDSHTHGEGDANDVESAKEENGIVYTSNPMMESDPKPDDEENKPLLGLTVKRIQGQLGNLELEMSTVRAETEGIETKVEGVDEETRLLRSQIGTLEQDNSSFKARLETLERMVTLPSSC